MSTPPSKLPVTLLPFILSAQIRSSLDREMETALDQFQQRGLSAQQCAVLSRTMLQIAKARKAIFMLDFDYGAMHRLPSAYT